MKEPHHIIKNENAEDEAVAMDLVNHSTSGQFQFLSFIWRERDETIKSLWRNEPIEEAM
jgi:hypothetical protein